MPPVARPTANARKTAVREVQATVPSRFASAPVSTKDQVQQFREARKLREQERLEKLRNCRLKNSASASINVSVANATSSVVSSGRYRPQAPVTSKVSAQAPVTSKVSAHAPSNVPQPRKFAAPTRVPHESNKPVAVATHSTSSDITNVRSNRLPASSKLRRSMGGRKSIVKSKIGCSKLKAPKAPKAEVKLTKTTQLRMLKADPFLQLAHFKKTPSNKRLVLPIPEPLRPKTTAKPVQLFGDGGSPTKIPGPKPVEMEIPRKTPQKPLRNIPLEDSREPRTPSRIPVKKASFASPLRQTPKPSPLRERLATWLEKRNHSLDNFKHLKCFGVLGPVVKRPQTPFRKVILSTSSLKVIPENKEATPSKDISEDLSDDDTNPLNSTFTLEEEDKENICFPKEQEENASAVPAPAVEHQGVKEFDQAFGVLSELHKLIQMGYPLEQCGLWLRAVRRRFPQCGDESIYWECLAALEEARGDLQTAVSCYERALLQGAEESSVQSSLDDLLKKMSSLNIEPVVSIQRGKPRENKLLDTSNIINSSSIQFSVKEKYTPSKNMEAEMESDCVFTATPVRRSMRLGQTPKQNTPGLKCVKSLEFLEPDVRRSLVFHTNSALDPED